MKLYIVIIFLLSYSISGNAQVYIADLETKEMLPFAVVKALHTSLAVYSDAAGAADIRQVNLSDTLLIEYSGHEKRKVWGVKNKDTIFLKSVPLELPTVSVIDKGLLAEKKIGIFKYYGGYQMLYTSSHEVVKKLIVPAQGGHEYKIQKIYLPLGMEKHKKATMESIVKIHIYNAYNGEPHRDILSRPLALDKNTLDPNGYYDISDQNIYTRDSVLFLGVDVLIFDREEEVIENSVAAKNTRKHMRIAEEESPLRLFARRGKDLNASNADKFCFMRTKIDPEYKWRAFPWGVRFSGGIVILTSHDELKAEKK